MEGLPLKPFDEMTESDYADIGFRCGLEVHQQLLTRTKLFCRCPAGRYSNDFDTEILRQMRPTLSEMGEYDGTALMEKKTRKNIHYRLNQETVCTYEFDDAPFHIADEAIDIALEIALLLQLNMVNELHIARKQYLDGSIPAGFQRTTVLGVDGCIPYRDRKIGIRQLGLEEDSCREVSDIGHARTYITDRLGTPLIEVVTEAEMYTPQQSAEVCRIIGRLCRSTQKVRRGYGGTRQDVNVSVRGGTRVEIKGVPQIWRIPRLVYNEASRQVALLRIRDKLRDRGVGPGTFEAHHADVSEVLKKAVYAPIRLAMGEGKVVRCVLLRGFQGLLNEITQEHTTFAKEFSDRVRVIACMTELPNMVHSDSASESLTAENWLKLRRRMRATDADELILVWGDRRDALTAAEEVVIRAREATEGIPSDTRQPLKDGTVGFERVLPGAERMYPDTDLPPIRILAERMEAARGRLPEHVWETEKRFLDAGMLPDDADWLSISPRAPLISRLITELKLDGKLLGVLLAQRWRAMRRAGLKPDRLSDDAIHLLCELHAQSRLAAGGLTVVLRRALSAHEEDIVSASDIQAVVDDLGEAPIKQDALAGAIDSIVAETDSSPYTTPAKLERALAGTLMERVIGRVEGRTAMAALREHLIAAGTYQEVQA